MAAHRPGGERSERARERRGAVAAVGFEREASRRRVVHDHVRRGGWPPVGHDDRVDRRVAGNHARGARLGHRQVRLRRDLVGVGGGARRGISEPRRILRARRVDEGARGVGRHRAREREGGGGAHREIHGGLDRAAPRPHGAARAAGPGARPRRPGEGRGKRIVLHVDAGNRIRPLVRHRDAVDGLAPGHDAGRAVRLRHRQVGDRGQHAHARLADVVGGDGVQRGAGRRGDVHDRIRATVGRRDGYGRRDHRAGAGCQGWHGAGEGGACVARDRAEGEPGRRRIGDDHAGGGRGPGVGDDDRERDRVAGRHHRRAARLGHLHVRRLADHGRVGGRIVTGGGIGRRRRVGSRWRCW